jgi:hypothetical protein
MRQNSGCESGSTPACGSIGAIRNSRFQDVSNVVNALANGRRSEAEIAKSTRLRADRSRGTKSLVADKLVIGLPDTPGSLFRLLDNGQDMLKGMRAAERRVKVVDSAY